MNVLISDYFEYYRLAAYLSQCTKERIAITMGAGSLRELFDEKYYTSLDGGILESFGRLFKNHLKIYCYPLIDPDTGQLITCDNLEVEDELKQLYGYLHDRGGISNLDNFDPDCLSIFSRDVLQKIGDCDPAWERMVPESVANVIKAKKVLRLPIANQTAVPSAVSRNLLLTCHAGDRQRRKADAEYHSPGQLRSPKLHMGWLLGQHEVS